MACKGKKKLTDKDYEYFSELYWNKGDYVRQERLYSPEIKKWDKFAKTNSYRTLNV